MSVQFERAHKGFWSEALRLHASVFLVIVYFLLYTSKRYGRAAAGSGVSRNYGHSTSRFKFSCRSQLPCGFERKPVP